MTTRGFKTTWHKARKAYRNAPHGRKSAALKALRNLVAQELRSEAGRT